MKALIEFKNGTRLIAKIQVYYRQGLKLKVLAEDGSDPIYDIDSEIEKYTYLMG